MRESKPLKIRIQGKSPNCVPKSEMGIGLHMCFENLACLKIDFKLRGFEA